MPETPPVDVMGGQTWDVFLSHASEDKEAVARPLAEALSDRGVSVWLDVLELRIGDSLRRRIDQGIRSSRFGIVVCSEAFFAKGWPQYELDGLVTRTVAGEQNLAVESPLQVVQQFPACQTVALTPRRPPGLAGFFFAGRT